MQIADSPAGATRDVVTDFAPGQDVLDLIWDRADEAPCPGNQPFRWVGAATLTGTTQLGYFVSGGSTIVRASTDATPRSNPETRQNTVVQRRIWKILQKWYFR